VLVCSSSLLIRGLILTAVRQKLHLAPCSDFRSQLSVRLDDSADLPVHIRQNKYCAFPCRDCLAVITIGPGWNFGWSRILKDEDVKNILIWFLSYACQYIHRSYIVAMLMTVWETHGKVLHPFGPEGIYNRYGPMRAMPGFDEAIEVAKQAAITSWGKDSHSGSSAATSSMWVNQNTLDPFLHQSMFHFLRAENLRSGDFGLEAVVAFDCVIQTVIGFLRNRFGLPAEPTRAELCTQLGLKVDFAELAEYIYFIRNNFGAHAGGWRWWDQVELLSDAVLSEMSDFTEQVLSAATNLERQVRVVEPSPAEWGVWLFQHFDMLWDSVWFDKLDRWNVIERSNRY
jgi:hypothetical protein